ncbi:hypothetical protein [Glycomyces albidus]|uniref:Ig-like domain-containing protein n=1 Tax=Glycomyces albidus TaxID=2656774 RepID=A0A6L5G8A6_9ACTN|nr:hypothetical protein [Glycomyces albidus]MQM25880.1 hypothetical protein [Glycomyces albidus]
MRYRRWIAKMAAVLMVFGAASLAAVIPASHATAAPVEAAACSVTAGIGGPTRVQSIVQVSFRINVDGCSGQYWTEYSNINGPGASDNGRTVTYRGDRNYVVTMNVTCRTGTYYASLQIIGESFDAFRETSKYIRC